MLARKLTGFASMTGQRYAFGVDAKKLVIGVPKEVHQNEARVAITPDTIQRVIKKNGANFLIEAGAGTGASISDKDYINAGAKIGSAKEAFSADVVLKIRPPQENPRQPRLRNCGEDCWHPQRDPPPHLPSQSTLLLSSSSLFRKASGRVEGE
jgi:hypothetical protein